MRTMMKAAALSFGWLTLVASTGCREKTISVAYDFAAGAEGWTHGFADLPEKHGERFELVGEIRERPKELGAGSAYYLQGHNRSDDLFMFLKRRLGPDEGLRAGQTYRVTYRLIVGSNAPANCVGIGGPPGEAVTLKAGAAPVEPNAVLDGDTLRMNVNKGEQSGGGLAASVIGPIANGLPCGEAGEPVPYVQLEREHQHSYEVQASESGDLWLLIGTDSGFEGATGLYFLSVEVELEPVD